MLEDMKVTRQVDAEMMETDQPRMIIDLTDTEVANTARRDLGAAAVAHAASSRSHRTKSPSRRTRSPRRERARSPQRREETSTKMKVDDDGTKRERAVSPLSKREQLADKLKSTKKLIRARSPTKRDKTPGKRDKSPSKRLSRRDKSPSKRAKEKVEKSPNLSSAIENSPSMIESSPSKAEKSRMDKSPSKRDKTPRRLRSPERVRSKAETAERTSSPNPLISSSSKLPPSPTLTRNMSQTAEIAGVSSLVSDPAGTKEDREKSMHAKDKMQEIKEAKRRLKASKAERRKKKREREKEKMVKMERDGKNDGLLIDDKDSVIPDKYHLNEDSTRRQEVQQAVASPIHHWYNNETFSGEQPPMARSMTPMDNGYTTPNRTISAGEDWASPAIGVSPNSYASWGSKAPAQTYSSMKPPGGGDGSYPVSGTYSDQSPTDRNADERPSESYMYAMEDGRERDMGYSEAAASRRSRGSAPSHLAISQGGIPSKLQSSIFNGHLMKWRFEAEEGSPFVRIPIFFCAVCLLCTTTFALIYYSSVWTIPDIVMSVFIFTIALLAVILEGRFLCVNPVGVRAHLRSTLTHIFFLRLLWGRGVLYMFGGILSCLLLTPPCVFAGVLTMVCAALAIFVGNYSSRRFHALRSSLRDPTYLMYQFEVQDYDNDGYITLSGFVALLIALGMELDDRYVVKAFNSADKDGDFKISYDDFAEWWADGYLRGGGGRSRDKFMNNFSEEALSHEDESDVDDMYHQMA